MFRIVFHVADSGRCPVRDFLDALPDIRAKARLLRAIQRLGEEGFLPEPFSKAISGSRKLRELRVGFDGNIYRVFYSLVSGRRIVLLHGFVKKTSKTPSGEILIADKRLRQFLEKDHEDPTKR
ncbi:MAG: type II toxin-antitoxin system RelE/ParE family toxin [Deltaproteobacteria bacterium]|nr:type II toxin-antitoxin system RelE/ParE family toxin [Deltaproteobacteria bacterium]